MVYPNGMFYAHAQPSEAAEIIEEHIEKGNVVKRLALLVQLSFAILLRCSFRLFLSCQ